MAPETRKPYLFGSRTRDRLLILLALTDELHVRGAARALGKGPSEIAKAVTSLERIGVVVSRIVGTTRVVSLNRRWYAAVELKALLERLGAADSELSAIAVRSRARPRRIGKPL